MKTYIVRFDSKISILGTESIHPKYTIFEFIYYEACHMLTNFVRIFLQKDICLNFGDDFPKFPNFPKIEGNYVTSCTNAGISFTECDDGSMYYKSLAGTKVSIAQTLGFIFPPFKNLEVQYGIHDSVKFGKFSISIIFVFWFIPYLYNF